ncbi:CvpA family protein [Paraburkholderia sp.]|uniref:CvpA family protein n=1 Tax=Paraburkholderia sp. TaxID=1926495 RepID=UPI0025DACE6C|nr:CvpA family protein [Paraburkholderia sp.]
MFTAFDYAVMAVIGVSALRGAWRGFIGEIFGLIGWIVAFLVACRYVEHVVPWMPAHWPGGAVTQWLIAFALIVIAVVFAAGVVNALLGRLVQVTGLSGVDRSLGLMFGLVRGVVLVLILVVLGGLTELPQQDFWRDALLRRYAEQGVRELKPLLPKTLAHYVHV